MKSIRRIVGFGLLPVLLAAGALSPAAAAEGGIGGLLIAPTRIVLEARDRSAELTLMNRGTRSETYRLEIVEKQMTEDGRLEDLPEGQVAPGSAAAMVRFSPRQVTLAPGQTQKVRLMARRSTKLKNGEYRSHLRIRTLPPPGEALQAIGPEGEGRLSVKLTTTTAVTIPVIVRHGATAFEIAITEMELKQDEDTASPRLAFSLQRTGTRSAYGDVTVEWSPADGGKPMTLARLRGVAVYVPNSRRRVEVPLAAAPGQLSAGRVRVAYLDPDEDAGSVLTEGELALE